jgi:hypothetical protein
MRIAKVFVSGLGRDAKFLEVLKVGSVKFDPRPGWVFCREVDKITRRCEVAWFHPADTHFEWVREFSA